MNPKDEGPVVEESPQGDRVDVTLRALELRIRQQEILSELGVLALQGTAFEKLLSETVRLTAEGLLAEFCKILEHIPGENRLLVRAGVGWDAGIVGVASVGADMESPAGFALRTGKPLISNHLENEERFRTPEILQRHGIRRAMNVILQGDGRPFGVLEVDSRDEDEFIEQDIAFLQGAANILGMAIERNRHERLLNAALERHQFLLKEMNHRVKNSLMIVSSMLRLQVNETQDETVIAQLDEASRRVAAVSRAHDRLSLSTDIEKLDIGKYIEAVCTDLDASVSHCEILTTVESGIRIVTHRAISAALIANELITNAAKYGYPDQQPGKIWVTVSRLGESDFFICIRDEGVGLPVGFDTSTAKGLGMLITNAFVSQLNAAITYRVLEPGTEFVVVIPVELSEGS